MCGIFKNKISTEKKVRLSEKSVKSEKIVSTESTHEKQDIHVIKSMKMKILYLFYLTNFYEKKYKCLRITFKKWWMVQKVFMGENIVGFRRFPNKN